MCNEMILPNGKTCGDCVHINRCKAIFGHVEADKYCDWFPIKFVEKKVESQDVK